MRYQYREKENSPQCHRGVSDIDIPASDMRQFVATLFAEIDLLEAYIAGLLSSAQQARLEDFRLVDNQLEVVQRKFRGLEDCNEIEVLRAVISPLSGAYQHYRTEMRS